ncbi:ribonuclease III [Aspergillus ibericus CBS 121593]|uniref:Ribonuclease III n=1 Tax=Aspergillus ibericus CBS 121593 TaxID=1448316 RepID=A0A395H605_9EURO|nr:ribonuclease III [Aspergillus ibericus CBS 121593]RAL03321.1 ribonuclease III [Aspergillus ibericus CBS 121593]
MSPSSALAEKVAPLQLIIGYTFTNPALLFEALQAAGSYIPTITTRFDGHKDLAQVGDAILQMVLTLDGYQTRKPRRKISSIITAKANNTNLAATGFNKSLDHFVMVNPAQGKSVSTNVMASTVEALLGAVYIDSNQNIDSVRSVMDALDLGWP